MDQKNPIDKLKCINTNLLKISCKYKEVFQLKEIDTENIKMVLKLMVVHSSIGIDVFDAFKFMTIEEYREGNLPERLGRIESIIYELVDGSRNCNPES